jgi:hypothetical protein
LLLLGAAWLGGSTTHPAQASSPPAAPQAAPASAAEQVTPNGAYMWNYSVKFVCGRQQPIDIPGTNAIGEPPVKPGNYATEINIHNYAYREFKLRKKLLVLVEKGEVVGREPDVVRPDPQRFASVVLTPDSATLDDCNALWKMAGGVPSAINPPLTIGYLVLLSPMDIDVDAVYTAEVGQRVAGAELEQPTGISIDVKRVPGKRVFVPAAFLAQFP